MDLYQFECFKSVAKYENITKAANELYISQPSLSMTIMRLEDEIGTKLFDRRGKKIHINDAGKILLHHIDNIDTELKKALSAINNVKGEKYINFALNASNIVKNITSDFLGKNNIPLKIIYSDSKTIEKGLLSGDIDAAICAPQLNNKQIKKLLLLLENIYIMVPYNHHLFNKKILTLNDIRNEPFLGLNKDSEFRVYIDNLLLEKGVVLNYISECERIATITALVSCKYLFIAAYPPNIAFYSNKNIPKINISYKHVVELTEKRPISLHYMDHMNKYTKEFIDFFKKNYYSSIKSAINSFYDE
ncbi:MAG: LysR family transcriptional regulator [Eubacteriales bacterium]